MTEATSDSGRTPSQSAVMYRNGLMIVLLAVCPIRLRNFCSLIIGTNILRIDDNWCIALGAKETKERRPDERPVPRFLTRWIDTYVESYRSMFGYAGKEMWSGIYGKPISYSGVERIITETTRRTLGLPISPHLFRSCSASTAYLRGADYPHLASTLLNHRGAITTQKHYNRSCCLFYAARFGNLIDS